MVYYKVKLYLLARLLTYLALCDILEGYLITYYDLLLGVCKALLLIVSPI